MKYYTLQWWNKCQILAWDHEEIAVPIEQYKRYYESIKAQLPEELVKFKDNYWLHDAHLRQMSIDIAQQEARFAFFIGMKPEEEALYGNKVTLVYQDLKFVGCSEDNDNSLAGPSGYGDLGYDEVELIGPNHFEHRLLFSSGIELTIRFADFSFEAGI